MVVLAALAALLLILGPTAYIRWVMARHGADRPDFPGTGGELARHLLDVAGLEQVKVESVPAGDHYDAEARTVRLAAEHHDGRSLTAVAVAAHEVAHAVQHRDGMRLYGLRRALAKLLVQTDRLAWIILLAAPLLAVVIRSPALMLLQVGLGLAVMALAVVVHLVTLPVELDASFRRALPALASGYVPPEDVPRARAVLRAAAFTYVAGALLSLLNVARLVRVFR